MRRATVLWVVCAVAVTLAVFISIMSVIVDASNKNETKAKAVELLDVVSNSIELMDNATDYDTISKLSSSEDIRITIIGKNGIVISDTLSSDVTNMESHIDRKEIVEALKGEIGYDIRKSDSFDARYVYVAKYGSGSNFIVRVALKLTPINSFLGEILLSAVIVFAVLVIIIYFVSDPISKRLLKPFLLIRERLENMPSCTTAQDSVDGLQLIESTKFRDVPILTSYDDVNAILFDIDRLSSTIAIFAENERKEKEILDLILDNIDHGVIGISKALHVCVCNKIATQLLNIPVDTHQDLRDFVRIPEFIKSIELAMETEKPYMFDVSLTNGKFLEIKIIPISAGEISRIITVSDVTDIRSIAKTKQEFFDNAGHELNTPLSSIVGYSEIMLLNNKYERQFMEIINKEAGNMDVLIKDMLKISEIESNTPFNDIPLNLKNIVLDVISSFSLKAVKKDIKVTYNLDLVYIFADPEKIAILVSNLVDNAIKYASTGGDIKIKLTQENEKAILSVEDDGIGIPQEYLSRIFERFFRVDKSRSRREGGTGLGLSIVKHIADRYNAIITVRSAENIGTTITVEFGLEGLTLVE
ncbi:MAG: GHKL domain-containing protein [Christensenellaceae bacterium]|jgi:two-component system phosphate regulon sensor histidine kinase PhoR|nr:GHKL domain-containing protein [Christensenellaceae bacterium]